MAELSSCVCYTVLRGAAHSWKRKRAWCGSNPTLPCWFSVRTMHPLLEVGYWKPLLLLCCRLFLPSDNIYWLDLFRGCGAGSVRIYDCCVLLMGWGLGMDSALPVLGVAHFPSRSSSTLGAMARLYTPNKSPHPVLLNHYQSTSSWTRAF